MYFTFTSLLVYAVLPLRGLKRVSYMYFFEKQQIVLLRTKRKAVSYDAIGVCSGQRRQVLSAL